MQEVFDILKRAGQLLLNFEKENLGIQEKSHQHDLVTKADLAVDSFLLSEMKRLFPNDQFLTEETDSLPSSYAGRVWMIDPLDGTKYFIHNKDCYAINIGLCEGGMPTFGVVYAPEKDMLIYGVKGEGAFVETSGTRTRLCVNNISSLADARVVTRYPLGESRKGDSLVESFPGGQVPAGAWGLKIETIASGQAECFISTSPQTSKWDTCAPQVFLEEAGGKMTFADGSKLDYAQKESCWGRPILASNTAVHDVVIDYMNKFNSL